MKTLGGYGIGLIEVLYYYDIENKWGSHAKVQMASR